MTTSTTPPYAGLKVLDLSQGIAGPYCAEILLQNGAEVTKVEPPAGDWGREIGWGRDGMSAIAVAYNLGKRSICIDAAREEGRRLLLRLAAGADVLIESFRPGVMQRLGLSYAELSRENARLVYVSMTGFGPDGPYADRPGTDSTLQALSGLMVANRDAQGVPRKVGILVVDAVAATYAAQAAGAALYRRAVQGEGGHVQVSLLGAIAALQASSILDSVLGGGQPLRPASVPAGTFATSDGHINVTSLHDKMFTGLCRAIKKESWLQDPLYATADARFDRAAQINEGVAAVFRGNTKAYWLETLRAHDVLCGPVCDYREFLDDPQVRHAQLFHPVTQAPYGSLPASRIPGADPARALEPAPKAGANALQVLLGLGMERTEIDELFRSGVVGRAASVQ